MPRGVPPDKKRDILQCVLEEPWRTQASIAAEVGVTQPTVGNYTREYPQRSGDRPLTRWNPEESELAIAILRNLDRRPVWIARAMDRHPSEGRRIARRLKEIAGDNLFDPGHDMAGAPSSPPGTSDEGASASMANTEDDRSRTPPVQEGELSQLEVVEYGDEGDGLAFLDGFAVFVPGAQVGDEVRARITSVGSKFAFAEVEEYVGRT